MSKTRVNTKIPPTALLIARHSETEVLCTSPNKRYPQQRELNKLDAFEAMCRKYAK